MKFWPFLAAIVLLPAAGSGATIGVYADSACSSCVTTIRPGETVRLFVCVNSQFGFRGGHFRVTGIPTGWSVAPRFTSIVSSFGGDAFEEGVAFSLAEEAIGSVRLMSVQVAATSDVANVQLRVDPPVIAAYICPTLRPACLRCENEFCALSNPFVFNGPDPCNTPVRGVSWSQTRFLYR
jgi:hypothetical protein